MATEVATQGLPLGGVVGTKTHHSGWTRATFGEVPEKVLVPSAPVIDSMAAPDQSAGIIELIVALPTTDTGSNALAQSEIVKVRMHHSTSSGVTTNDSYVDFPPGVTMSWNPGDVVTHYVAVRVQDTHDHWSALSNEESAAANGGTEPEYDGLWAHRLGTDATWTEDSPDTNSIAWSGVILYWKANKYTIADGNTDKKYLWWDYDVSTTTFQSSDTKPTLTYQDVLVATNDAGKLYLTMYSPMVIADFIRAGIIQSSNWAASAGSQIDLDAGKIVLGGSGETGFRALSTGAVYMGSDLTWDTSELVMLGTLKTSAAVDIARLTLFGASAGASDRHKLIAYDSSNDPRVVFDTSALEIFETGGSTTLTVFPSTPATSAYIGNTLVFVDNDLIVGRSTDPSTSDALHVTGTGLFTSTVVVGDHGESTTPSVVNVLFYTAGNLPTASTTPRGTFAVQVPA